MSVRLTLTACMIMTVSFAVPGWCSTPYSSNGVGLIIPDDPGRVKAMGGTGTADADGQNLMRGNPALIASFAKPSYAAGATYTRSTVFTGAEEVPITAKTSPELFRIIVPVSRGVVVGWGLSQYSRSESQFRLASDGYKDSISSTGGISVSSTVIAYSFKEFIRVGLAFNYNFGNVQENWSRIFTDSENYHPTYYYFNKKYKGYSRSFGAIINATKGTALGISYTGESELSQSIGRKPTKFSNSELIFDRSKVFLPSNVKFGVTSALGRRFKASVDYSISNWEDAARTAKEKEMYTNTFAFGTGIRYEPAAIIGTQYYKILPLMAGFRIGSNYYKSYSKSHYPDNTDIIMEKALSFGIEFPFRETGGVLITSIEFGTRGDKGDNGWDESFINAGIVLLGVIK